MYNELIFLRKNWQMSFHLLSVQFCNYVVFCLTQIFYSDWVVFTKNFIHDVVRVTVVMAVDFPILSGRCMNINILLFSSNKINAITCYLLLILDCRWSLWLWQMYSYEKLVSTKSASWKKMALKSSNFFIHQQMHFLLILENSKIYIKLILKLLLHVSVYNQPQGAYTWAWLQLYLC
jgi:hypothetical protein